MTKKDFQLIADVLSGLMPKSVPHDAQDLRDLAVIRTTLHSTAHILAQRFEQEFPRFDRDKFLRAAGV
jgi:hypothetical protein